MVVQWLCSETLATKQRSVSIHPFAGLNKQPVDVNKQTALSDATDVRKKNNVLSPFEQSLNLEPASHATNS